MIPRRIHQVFFRETAMPDHICASPEAWRRLQRRWSPLLSLLVAALVAGTLVLAGGSGP